MVTPNAEQEILKFGLIASQNAIAFVRKGTELHNAFNALSWGNCVEITGETDNFVYYQLTSEGKRYAYSRYPKLRLIR